MKCHKEVTTLYFAFVSNVIGVLFFCAVIIWIDLSLNKKYSRYILGVMFGLATIYTINQPILVVNGFLLDFRHITLILAGFVGGPVTAIITALMSLLYRFLHGGSGTIVGISIIILSAFMGCILAQLLRSSRYRKQPLLWFGIGIAIACILQIILVLTLPGNSNSGTIERMVFVPFLIITPFAITVIFSFYFKIHEFLSKATILKAIIDRSPINLMIFDANGPILFSNHLKTELQSYPYIENPNQLLGSDKTWLNRSRQKQIESTSEDQNYVTELSSFQMPSGKYAYLGIVNDITDQNQEIKEKELEHQKLIESQEEVASILEGMTDCFIAVNRDLQFAYINRAAEVTLGKSREELLGLKPTEVLEIDKTSLEHYKKVMYDKKSITFEVLSKTFGDKWHEVSAYPSKGGISCYFRDITIRKRSEELLRQSEEKFSKAFHGGPIMMALATVNEGEFIDVNDAFCSTTGYCREEIIGRTIEELDLFLDIDKNQNQNSMKVLLELGRIDDLEFAYRTKSGEIRYGQSWSQLIYLRGRPCHITGHIDITEQKHIQEEMTKLDRLNLIGQMAASIAHEIRNPMTTVRGYLQLLGFKPENTTLRPTYEIMISEIDRANAMITEFLSLAQTKKTELKFQSLNDILNNLYPLIEADTFNQNKQMRFIPEELPNLHLDRKEISQLVLNLTRNGLEAMGERGCLTVKSYQQDNMAVLAISDEGCGIPLENISKMGTPFFTNKVNGTGLGLATCYKIAKSHNAKVDIDSSPSGTTFFIQFPIPDKELRKME